MAAVRVLQDKQQAAGEQKSLALSTDEERRSGSRAAKPAAADNTPPCAGLSLLAAMLWEVSGTRQHLRRASVFITVMLLCLASL